MGFDLFNLHEASHSFEEAAGRIIETRLEPLVDKSIRQVSGEVTQVISEAGAQIERNIAKLSQEIHDHRSMTRDDIVALIDYAASQFGKAIDQRVIAIKDEASELINEKVLLLKAELDEAATLSRKTMLTNVAISVGAALLIAAVSLVYKKISLGEFDLLTVFRVGLLSCATFSAVLAALKALQRWRGMGQVKKGAATVAIGYLGVLRPNGATGWFLLSVLLVAGWAGIQYYAG